MVSVYVNKFFVLLQFFSKFQFWKLSVEARRLIKKILVIWAKLSVTRAIIKENRAIIWDRPFADLRLSFCPYFWLCVVLLILFRCFWRILLSKTCDESTVCVEFLCSAVGYTLSAPRLRTCWFFEIFLFLYQSLDRPNGAICISFTISWKVLNCVTKIWQNLLFLSTLPATSTFGCHARKIEGLDFVQGVIFDFFDSLKNKGTNCLLMFDSYCGEICSSTTFVDLAIVGRSRGLCAVYIKQNLFHQSRVGRDVQLQSRPDVLFISLRDLMQVSTLCQS